MAGAPREAALRRRIEAFLEARNVMTLATVGPEGPWAAAVFYASDGLELYFVSAPGSRHCRDLEAGSAVAATIHTDCSDWRDVKGVQLKGTAERLAGPGRIRAVRRYGTKFPVVRNLAAVPVQIAMALRRSAWYRIVPRRIRLIDNSRGLGHKDELVLA